MRVLDRPPVPGEAGEHRPAVALEAQRDEAGVIEPALDDGR